MSTDSLEQDAPLDSSDEAMSFGIASRDALPIIMLAAAVASGLSGQQPTGNVAADFLLAFGFGGTLVWLSRYASAQALLLASVLALFFSGLQFPAVLMGLAAVVATLFITTWRRFDGDSRAIGAAIATAFVSQAVLNLPSIGFFGSASLLAAVAIAPIVVTAYTAMPSEFRRKAHLAVGAVLLYAVLASVGAIIAALGARGLVETGIEQAEDGISAVEAGDQPQAVSLLAAAEENFDVAHGRLSSPLTWPARFVPVVAQHARALETAADQGAALASTAGRIVTRADVEQIRGQNGKIDLEIVQDINVELTQATLVLGGAQQSLNDVRTGWLLPLLSSRLDSVQVELADTTNDIDLATHATAVLPDIMGASGERRYLVLFVQPAESREYGGLVGAYGMLEATDGAFELAESGSIDVDLGLGRASFSDPGAFPEAYVNIGPQINPQNLTAVGDLTTIAAAARDFVPQLRGNPDYTIDGVITIDPYALAGVLELTGPITIEGADTAIDADNVVDFLLRDQYLAFDPQARNERQELLRSLAGNAFEELLSIEVPGPERLGAVFGPIARANRLGFVTYNDAENVFLDRIFLTANIPPPVDGTDMLAIFTATGTASKLDAYIHRATTYTVDVDPSTGAVAGIVAVNIANDAPADASDYVLGNTQAVALSGEPLTVGTNLLALSVYAPQEIADVASTGAIEYRGSAGALGHERSWMVVEVPLGGEVTTSFTTTATAAPERYDLVVPASQSANPVDFTLVVRPAAGWRVLADDVNADGSWSRTVSTESGNLFTLFFGPAE